MDFFRDKKKMRTARNIITWLFLIVGAVIVYILVNGGDLSSFIEELKISVAIIGAIGIYWIIGLLSVSSMAIEKATLDIESKNDKIQKLRQDNAILNNELDFKYANKYTDIYNEETFKQMQETANKQKIRILKAKLYKVSDVLRAEKTDKRLEAINKAIALPLPKNKFKRLLRGLNNIIRKLIKIRLLQKQKFYASKSKIETLLEKYESGQLNAKFKFKPIRTKQYTSIHLENYNKRENKNRLHSNKKAKRFATITIKALITNTVTTAGLFMAFKNFIDFNIAEQWEGLAIFLVIFVLSLIWKYFSQNISWYREYPEDIMEILTNIFNLRTGAVRYQREQKKLEKEQANVVETKKPVELPKTEDKPVLELVEV